MVPRDRAGSGCQFCDPIVRRTVYGKPGDTVVRVVDSLNADGTVSRAIFTRGYVDRIAVRVAFVPPVPK